MMEVQFLIKANREARKLSDIDPHIYALKNPEKWEPEFLREVLNQFQMLQKLVKKLPDWSKNEDIIGSAMLNLEQCSSEKTAFHKFKKFEGESSLDLTGGFGVDSYYLSKKFKRHTICETNTNLLNVVEHNFKVLDIQNTTFFNSDAESFLANNRARFDLIYIDPDRRNKSNKKMVLLEDCSPDIIQIQDELLKIGSEILVKYSPLLDIHLALSKIKHVKSLEILAVKNEVKELLIHISADCKSEDAEIVSTNIKEKRTDIFKHSINDERKSEISFEVPQNFLYEPNASILKSGAFKIVGLRYDLRKLAQHSHFYTSEVLKMDFPGRIFKIKDVFLYGTKAIKLFKKGKFNVIARNFPLNPVTICKKHQLINGGEDYLIFTQDYNNKKIILSCHRIF
jgi:hypothetical protein